MRARSLLRYVMMSSCFAALSRREVVLLPRAATFADARARYFAAMSRRRVCLRRDMDTAPAAITTKLLVRRMPVHFYQPPRRAVAARPRTRTFAITT